MRMMSIASGSNGNCIYIGSDKAHILIDDGISRKKVIEGLSRLNLKLEDIDAILITHEHDDHIKGLGVLERGIPTPIYSMEGTLNKILENHSLGNLPEGIMHSIASGTEFRIKDILINSISISHDAISPVAYKFECDGRRAGIVTDLGEYDSRIIDFFSGMNAMLIEANHDINMLLTGPYPYPLKQRILGKYGHLSNESCGRLLSELLNDAMNTVFLGHLSHENNFPDLAYETVKAEINLYDNKYKADDFDIKVAHRGEPSDIITF